MISGHPSPAGVGAGVWLLRAARALTALVQVFVAVTFVVLVLGFFLLLFGANADAPFAEWIYRALERAMAPFRGIFESVQITGSSVLDTSVLFAMIVYGIAGLALGTLIDWLSQALWSARAR